MTDERHIVIAGAGYAGLHIAQRIGARTKRKGVRVTLVDRHDYHQLLTELPRVAAGTRSARAVRVPLESVLDDNVEFVQATISAFDLASGALLTAKGPVPYTNLVLALGSTPNDFGIPGLTTHALSLWSVEDAKKVLAAIDTQVVAAAHTSDVTERERLLTVVIGGGGATGVELAGELAEVMPGILRRHDLLEAKPRIVLVEAGPTLLLGSSDKLVSLATATLGELGVDVRLGTAIVSADANGFALCEDKRVDAGVMVWAGGIKAPNVVADSGLPTGKNGRVLVQPTLRVVSRPEIYVAGDLAYLVDEATGRALPPTAQMALEEGDTVAHNLMAELNGTKLQSFQFRNKGYVVSIGQNSGAADVGPVTIGGRPAMMLKNAIEWEYRQSVKHLKGWSPV